MNDNEQKYIFKLNKYPGYDDGGIPWSTIFFKEEDILLKDMLKMTESFLRRLDRLDNRLDILQKGLKLLNICVSLGFLFIFLENGHIARWIL